MYYLARVCKLTDGLKYANNQTNQNVLVHVVVSRRAIQDPGSFQPLRSPPQDLYQMHPVRGRKNREYFKYLLWK